jgi:hypothetical protein
MFNVECIMLIVERQRYEIPEPEKIPSGPKALPPLPAKD